LIVINPTKDDDAGFSVVAKEEPILLEKLGPEPIFVFGAEGITLAIFRPLWILRDDIKKRTRSWRVADEDRD
jgi:hypothetical protein